MADSTTGNTGPPVKPYADLKSLDRLVGTWKTTDPTGKGELKGTVTYEWMEGGFFLIQRVDLDQNGHRTRGIEIIGHERLFGSTEPSKDIRSRFYSDSGDTLDYVYEVTARTLTIWGGEKGSPAYFKGDFRTRQRAAAGLDVGGHFVAWCGTGQSSLTVWTEPK
jgi:hypothetical protein